MQTKTLQQVVTFKASPRQVYDMIMDSRKHSSLSGEPAKIGNKVGWLACRGPIRSVETTRVSLATKAAVARLIGTDGTQEVNLAKCRP